MEITFANEKTKKIWLDPNGSSKFRVISKQIKTTEMKLRSSETLSQALMLYPGMNVKKMKPGPGNKYKNCWRVKFNNKYRLIFIPDDQNPNHATIIDIQYIDDHSY